VKSEGKEGFLNQARRVNLHWLLVDRNGKRALRVKRESSKGASKRGGASEGELLFSIVMGRL